MLAKPGVSLKDVKFELGFAAGVAQEAYAMLGYRLVVTSANDGKHMPDSLHYKGLAIDLRTKEVRGDDLGKLLGILKMRLEPAGFDVILETDHIHVEFDPKPGEQFAATVG